MLMIEGKYMEDKRKEFGPQGRPESGNGPQGRPDNGFPTDLQAHGKAMGIFRNIAMAMGFVFWVATLIIVGVLTRYEDKPFAFNIAGLWGVISMTILLCMNFYMTVQSKRFSEHFAKRGKDLQQFREQNQDIIKSLCSNFSAVYYIDLDTGELKFLQIGNRIQHYMGQEYSEDHTFEWYVESYCKKIVLPEYQEEFIKQLTRDNLREKLSTRDYYTYTYLGDKNGRPNYFEMKVTKCNNEESKLVIGFADVDAEVRENREKNMLLKDALMQAERANKTKDVFLSNVSHELLTPLNEISGRATLIALNAEVGEEASGDANSIVNAAERMAFLINDILDISMIENGEMVLHDSNINIRSILEEAVERTIEGAKEKKITVNYSSNLIHDEVVGDGARVYSIIKRLQDFAVDFSKKESTIFINAEEVGSIGNRARYTVSIECDDLHISEEEIKAMYDTFFKNPTADGEKVSATGTGLLISKCIIEMMKGKLEIKGNGKGGTLISATMGLLIADRG